MEDFLPRFYLQGLVPTQAANGKGCGPGFYNLVVQIIPGRLLTCIEFLLKDFYKQVPEHLVGRLPYGACTTFCHCQSIPLHLGQALLSSLLFHASLNQFCPGIIQFYRACKQAMNLANISRPYANMICWPY